MAEVTVQLPDDTFVAARRGPHEVAREMRVALAVRWYAEGIVSQGKGAEIAGLSQSEFIDALARADVSVSQESVEDVDEVLRRG